MIKRETLLSLNFYKKAAFTGGDKKFRYRIEKREDMLAACAWEGPYAYTATPDEKKKWKETELSEEGLKEIAKWLTDLERNL